jgi:hypothetical protein
MTRGDGCVALFHPPGVDDQDPTNDQWTELDVRRAGPVRISAGFSLARVGPTSRRCTS